MIIWRERDLTDFKAGKCDYNDSPWIEVHATPEQEQAIATLKAKVVPHSYVGERQHLALVSIPDHPRSKAAWINPVGIVTETSMSQGYYCSGNPTEADCIAAGYCRRRYACND